MPPLAQLIRRHATLSQQVYDALLQSITAGDMAPGERIVVERLAEQLGVSPTPVREALGRLAQEGLTEDGDNGKLRVVSLTPDYVSYTYEVRAALEGLAAELAATRLLDTQLVQLHRTMNEVDQALHDRNLETYVRSDQHLHQAICDAAGNPVLTRELRPLQAHVDFIRAFSRRQIGDHIYLSHTEHKRILEALDRREPQEARRAMEDHIRKAGARIVHLIDFKDRSVEAGLE